MCVCVWCVCGGVSLCVCVCACARTLYKMTLDALDYAVMHTTELQLVELNLSITCFSVQYKVNGTLRINSICTQLSPYIQQIPCYLASAHSPTQQILSCSASADSPTQQI